MNAPQTELHRHLDVSLRTSTLLSLAQRQGLEPMSTSPEAFREKVILKEPLADLSSVLGLFTLFQRVLDSPETLERVAFEAVEDCWNEGTRKLELRYSPSFVCEFSHLHWDESIQGFERGIQKALQKYPEMKVGMICIASRDYGTQITQQTVEFFLKHQKSFAGLDLAGNEVNFPCRIFEEAFKPAIKAGAKITVHAGEATGPENIWEAVELLGARRIGHGISAIQDPKLMEHLAKKSICLEMCPTSNWLTQAVKTFEEHPLPKVLRAGVPVCINTDDPAVFGVTIPSEMEICRTRMGMTQEEILQCQSHASRASFVSE